MKHHARGLRAAGFLGFAALLLFLAAVLIPIALRLVLSAVFLMAGFLVAAGLAVALLAVVLLVAALLAVEGFGAVLLLAAPDFLGPAVVLLAGFAAAGLRVPVFA